MHEESSERPSGHRSTRDRSAADYLGLGLRGVCIGSADIVPGVSGGTMAFILGIYEELIDSIRGFGRRDFLWALARLRLRDAFAIINWRFLLAVGAGVGLAILTLARGLGWLLEHHPVYVWSFFFGLVFASVIAVSRRIDRWPPLLGVTLVAGAIAAYIFVGLVPLETPETWWFLFVAGAMASCAMILPGISGAFLLLLLGKYEYVLDAVERIDIGRLVFVGAGAAVGLISFTQVLGWLLRKYHDLMIALLTGLMLGSLRKVWPWKEDVDWLRDAGGGFVLDSHGQRKVIEQALVLPDVSSGAMIGEVAGAVALALVGFGAIVVIDRFAESRKEERREEAIAASRGEK